MRMLIDVRNYPGSKRYPHFNKEVLEEFLPQHEISYLHLKDLGGRRKPAPDSHNNAWRNPAFRGYADYMGTDAFKQAVAKLKEIALRQRTVYMCSEAVWWSCHRALISDYLKAEGWKVWHIMDEGKATEHPFTSAARVSGGQLSYHEPGLFET